MLMQQALSGTLVTAKKKGIVAFDAEMLMQGRDDRATVTLLRHTVPDGDEDSCKYTAQTLPDSHRYISTAPALFCGKQKRQGLQQNQSPMCVRGMHA